MQIKVTITRHSTTIFENTYAVAGEGDIERAVSDALSEARKLAGGAAFDYVINVSKP